MRFPWLVLGILAACGGGGSSPNDGGGDGGSGKQCGGFANVQCSATEYCDFPRNTCGAADEPGVCKPRPTACPDTLVAEPTCACDGQVHGNECDANAAGSDVDASGSCTVPGGSFACGYRQCTIQQQYCERQTSDVGSEPDDFSCEALPACPSQFPTCSCLASVPCGDLCTGDGQTGLTVTCPGG
ncbi:MAG TPA: hypothetical protein VIU61_10025 [Kofleriaceae bacterium]